MPTSIQLPNLGENIESGDVLAILVSEGDHVDLEQDLIELETDKATVPIPSPTAGRIVKILVGEGDTVPVGAPICEIEASGDTAAPPSEQAAPAEQAPPTEQAAPAEQAPPRPTAPAPTPAVAPIAATQEPTARPTTEHFVTDEDLPGDGHSAAAAGPAVRRLARQLGVDLRRVRPSGEDGRVTAKDVQAHVRSANEQATASASPSITPPGTPQTDGHGAVRIEKMSRLRQTIARNMAASYTTVPQLTNFDDVDVSELEEIREQSKADYAQQGLKLTTMPFLIKAIASALKLHPVVNASVDIENNHLIYKEYVNIGVAVDTDRGLVVPVIRDADRLSISNITRELARLVEMVKGGSFGVDDLRGGTFTISNLGAVGGTYSTPIINSPEVAILLVGRSRELPLYVAGQLEPRLIMPLSLTYDHRVVDGAAAARFLNEVKGFLAAPGRLLLAP